MFISKAEKDGIHELLNTLRRHLDRTEAVFFDCIQNIEKRLDAIEKKPNQVKITSRSKTPEAKREYAKAYYWRKKAERLANGSKKKVKPMNSKENHESKAAVNKSV